MDKNDKKGIISLLTELISIPGLSGAEDEVMEYIRGRIERMGINWFEDQGNIYAVRGNPEFVIATHVDTVPSWGFHEAFKPYYDGMRIWGRGALDTKGQIAPLLWALKDGKNFFVAFLRDEEEGGSGSKCFCVPDGLNIKGAIILEPTSLKICTSQAGSIELEIITKGKATHGATVKEGENAIERFIKFFQTIKERFKYNHPLFPSAGINIGYIRGGVDVQVVPDICTAKIDISVLPGENPDKILKEIKDIIKGMGSIEYRVLEKSCPWAVSEEEWIVKRLSQSYRRALKITPSFSGMPAWTDASNIMEKGIPCTIFGAGALCWAHTSREHIYIDELYKLFLVIEKLVE